MDSRLGPLAPVRILTDGYNVGRLSR